MGRDYSHGWRLHEQPAAFIDLNHRVPVMVVVDQSRTVMEVMAVAGGDGPLWELPWEPVTKLGPGPANITPLNRTLHHPEAL